jgi:spore coat protein U-like protein
MRGALWLVWIAVLGGALFLNEGSALAQVNICTVSATSVSFGIYDVFSATDLTSTGSVTFNCHPKGSNVRVWLSKGLNAPTNAPRQMTSGINRLNYDLCQDANCSTRWGDCTYPTEYGPVDLPNNKDVTLTVYGRILAGQDVPAGTYTDRVTVTIDF